MATIILTSILALLAAVVAVVPAAIIIWQDGRRPAPAGPRWSVVDEAQLVLVAGERPAVHS